MDESLRALGTSAALLMFAGKRAGPVSPRTISLSSVRPGTPRGSQRSSRAPSAVGSEIDAENEEGSELPKDVNEVFKKLISFHFSMFKSRLYSRLAGDYSRWLFLPATSYLV